MPAILGIIRETAEGERRVAMDPATAGKLAAAGHTVLVQSGAGTAAGHPDAAWKDCELVDGAADIAARADVLVTVRRPADEVLAALRSDAVLVGSLAPHHETSALVTAAKNGPAMLAMELIPRITRAQAMDVLSSQATISGYKAVIHAADIAPRLFPMLTTAAGTLRPARVVVIGAGVAGLQAIATARRLGAQVEAYDIRADAREQVESLGAKLIDTGVDATGEGGYARELTDEEKAKQTEVLAKRLERADAVIATAGVPGRPAPKIISADMVANMKNGAVIVDLRAENGGNCELTQPGETIEHGGVLIAGPNNVPSLAAVHASEMYGRNLLALLDPVLGEEGVHVDLEDAVFDACALVHAGTIRHEATRRKIEGEG